MHMNKTTVIASGIVLLFLAACSSSNPDMTLGRVGSENIRLSEFEEIYAKNNGGWEKAAGSSLEEREKFLDLFVKFRLKVLEAYQRGLLQDSSVQEELKSYNLSVATSYMIEKELVEPKIHSLYKKRMEYLRASHILIRLADDASPDDTARAYARAMEIIEKVPAVPFDSLARTYSEDPSAARNGGDLGYFQAGRMVTGFEDACYALQPGEYTSKPVRTRFGYHVIKLTDRKPHRGTVQISHILKRFKPDLSDTAAVRDSVYALYEKLRQGLDFGIAAREYSDDPQSEQRGGDLGFFEWAQLPPEVGNLVFDHPDQSLFEPIRMPYGYHIVKVGQRKQPPTFEELEKEIRNQYQQTRYPGDYDDYVHELKKKYNLWFDVRLLYDLTHAFDSTRTPAVQNWSEPISQETRSKVLFRYDNKEYTVANLLSDLEKADEFRSTRLTPENLERMIERISGTKVLEAHAERAPERHPQFAKLMKEYQDGILLYRLEQEEVWKKIQVSDSLLRQYYEQHKESFRWPHRVAFVEIHLKSRHLADSLYERITKHGESIEELAARFTERPGYREKKGKWELQPYRPDDISLILGPVAVDSVLPPTQEADGWSIVKVVQKDSARVKTFEEASADVASKYQEYASQKREEEWVEELKNKYGVTLRKELLSEAFKRRKSESR